MPRRTNGPRIRHWRRQEGLTLAEISGLTGISTAMFCLVEQGKKRFAASTKVLIARRLGVPVQDLFEVDPIEDAVEESSWP